MSDAEPEPPRERPGAKKPAPWPDFAAALAWPEAAPPWVALGHRRDGTLIHVRVAPDGLTAYRALSAEAVMPDGARVVAWHEAPGGGLLGGYLLEKRGGVWSAIQLAADGSLVPGDRAACVRCHDMAPTDHLFGVRSAPPPPAPLAPPNTGESIIPAQR
jgi:hypothetical protein